MLLYTYISRFSVNPHYQQMRKIRQSCHHKFYPQPFLIPIFNFSHKRPTFAFTDESEYTLGPAQRIAHKGTHGETGGVSDGVVSLPSDRSVRSQTSPGRVSERQVLPLLGLGQVCSRRTQRACGIAMRSCASLLRGVAAPLGCVVLLLLSVQRDLTIWKDLTKRFDRVTITRNDQAASRLALVQRLRWAVK